MRAEARWNTMPPSTWSGRRIRRRSALQADEAPCRPSRRSLRPKRSRPSWKRPCRIWVSSLPPCVCIASSGPHRCEAGKPWPSDRRVPTPGSSACRDRSSARRSRRSRAAPWASAGRLVQQEASPRPSPARADGRCINGGHRPVQRIRRQCRWFQRVEQGASGCFEDVQAFAASRTGFEMAGQQERWTACKAAGGLAQQEVVVGMMLDHGSRLVEQSTQMYAASRTRDLTVPRGMPRSSRCGHGDAPRRTRGVRTSACSAGSRAKAVRTRDSRPARRLLFERRRRVGPRLHVVLAVGADPMPGTPEMVRAQVARDGEDPRGRPAWRGSKVAALRHTFTRVSWASSSASPSLLPQRIR